MAGLCALESVQSDFADSVAAELAAAGYLVDVQEGVTRLGLDPDNAAVTVGCPEGSSGSGYERQVEFTSDLPRASASSIAASVKNLMAQCNTRVITVPTGPGDVTGKVAVLMPTGAVNYYPPETAAAVVRQSGGSLYSPGGYETYAKRPAAETAAEIAVVTAHRAVAGAAAPVVAQRTVSPEPRIVTGAAPTVAVQPSVTETIIQQAQQQAAAFSLPTSIPTWAYLAGGAVVVMMLMKGK